MPEFRTALKERMKRTKDELPTGLMREVLRQCFCWKTVNHRFEFDLSGSGDLQTAHLVSEATVDRGLRP